VCFVVLSSLLTKFILNYIWLLVPWLEPIYPMDMVSISVYLGLIQQGSGMNYKDQDQNQAITASKVKIRIKQLCIDDLPRWTTGFPTKTDCHTQFTMTQFTMISFTSATLFSIQLQDGPYLQQCRATSLSGTTSSFHEVLRGGFKWNLCQIPQKTTQDPGVIKNSF